MVEYRALFPLLRLALRATTAKQDASIFHRIFVPRYRISEIILEQIAFSPARVSLISEAALKFYKN
jgi:hypothetical protein